MFRKCLAILLQLAMLTASVSMSPATVLAAEEFQVLSEDGEISEIISDGDEVQEGIPEDAFEAVSKATEQEALQKSDTEEVCEDDASDMILEDVEILDSEDLIDIEPEALASGNENSLLPDEEENDFAGWEVMNISFDGLTQEDSTSIFANKEHWITMQSDLFDHEAAQGKTLQYNWALYTGTSDGPSEDTVIELDGQREIILKREDLIPAVNALRSGEDRLYVKAEISYGNILLANGQFMVQPVYDMELNGLIEGMDRYVYVFEDEIHDISVSSDIFYEYNDLEVHWELYAINREMDTEDSGYALYDYWKTGSETDYVLDGANVKSFTNWSDTVLRMRAAVCKGDYEFASKEFTIDYYEKENFYYEDDRDIILAPGGEKWISEIREYIRDQYHPFGEMVTCQVTDVTTTSDDVCSVYKEGTAYRIAANNFGSAEATVSYYDYYGQERSYHFTIEVNSDVLYLDILYPENSNYMLPNTTNEIETTLKHVWYYSDGQQGSEMIEDYTISLLTDDENPGYNPELMDVSVLPDGKTLQVCTKDKSGESDICIHTNVLIGSGSERVSADAKAHVNIADRYFYCEEFSYNADARVGEPVSICPVIKFRRIENGEVITEDFDGRFWFTWNGDNEDFDVQEIDGGIAITRKRDDRTGMNIRCMVKNENSDFAVFSELFNFNEVDHEWVITYEWSADLNQCTAKAQCKYDSKTQYESVHSEKKVKVPAGCKTNEIISCRAAFKNALFAVQTKELKGKKALGHTYVNNKCIRCSVYEMLEAPALTKVENATNGVKFTWSAVKNAKKYNIYRKLDTGKWEKIGSSTTTAYTDMKAASGKKYSYSVCCAANDGSNKAISSYNPKGLSITRLATIKPTLSNSNAAIKIKWKKVAGAAGYVIYRKVGSGKFKKLTTIKKNKTVSYIDKKVKKRKTYTYYVYAYNGAVTGAYVPKSLKKK